MDKSKKQIIISLIENGVILLFLFIIGSGLVMSPIYGDISVIDEGQFAAWISHMLSGQHLYKDIYAAYGPFYIYPLYFLSKIFGPSLFLIRIVYIVLNTFIATLIVQILLKEFEIPRILKYFFVGIILVIPAFGMRQGIGLLTILFMYKSLEKKNIRWSILTGISLAFSFLTSSDTGIFVSAVFLIYAFFKYIFVKDVLFLSRKILVIFLSFITILFIFYLWSTSEGWFNSYFNSIVTDLTLYSGIALPNGQNFPNAIALIPHNLQFLSWVKYFFSKELLLYWLFLLYVITFIYMFMRIILNKYNSKDILVSLIGIYGFFLATILIGRYGHFPYTLAPAFILFAFYSNNLLRFFQSTKNNRDKISSFVLIFIIFIFSIRIISLYRPHFINILKVLPAAMSNKNTVAFLGPVAISQKQEKSFQLIQSFVFTHTNKNESIFFLGNEPVMYMLVNRKDATRYDIPVVPNIIEKRYEVLNELITNQPKYIIDDHDAWAVDGVSNERRLPEVMQYINKNYTKKELKNFIIYNRRVTKS